MDERQRKTEVDTEEKSRTDRQGGREMDTDLLYQTMGISVMVYLREEAPSLTPCRSAQMP